MKGVSWRGGSLIPEELREAASGIGAAIRQGGVDLQKLVIEDLNRMLNAYPGWDVVYGERLGKSLDLLKQVGTEHEGKLHIPDIDAVLVNPIGKIVLVISSKGSIQDDKIYSTIFHHDYFSKRGIEFWVVTKDTKATFKSGKSKYFAFIPPSLKIFINNETTYNEEIKHNFGDWNFNEIVRPYPEIFIHFVELIKNLESSNSNEFFNFNK